MVEAGFHTHASRITDYKLPGMVIFPNHFRKRHTEPDFRDLLSATPIRTPRRPSRIQISGPNPYSRSRCHGSQTARFCNSEAGNSTCYIRVRFSRQNEQFVFQDAGTVFDLSVFVGHPRKPSTVQTSKSNARTCNNYARVIRPLPPRDRTGLSPPG